MAHAPARPGTGKWRCHYCGRRPKRMTKDHIIPKARGGTDYSWNLAPACYPCNQAKGDDLPTCECDRCAAAVQWHLKYLEGFAPGARAALAAQVAGLCLDVEQQVHRGRW